MGRTGWDAFAAAGEQRRTVNAAGETTWFNWTQYPDHGPGAELLDPRPGMTVLDLGCGKGGNTAHLATFGCCAVGVDIAARQLDDARQRWGVGANLRWVRRDALEFLAGQRSVDTVISVLGAVYFTDPAVLLPAVHAALVPGGRLVFSQPPPPADTTHGRHATVRRIDGSTVRALPRWHYPPPVWRDLLTEHGLVCTDATILGPPDGGDGVGTMLVRARRA